MALNEAQIESLERFAAAHPPRRTLSLVDGLGIEPRAPLGIVTPLELNTVDRLAEVLGSPRYAEQLDNALMVLTRYRFRILHGFHRSCFRQATGEVRDTTAAQILTPSQR
jgi:hypothetical protein